MTDSTEITVEAGPDLSPALLDALDQIADQVIEAGLVPDSYRSGKGPNTPAEVRSRVKIALLKGHEVGLKPLQALQWIAIINGRPVIWGDALPGLVNASGKCAWVKETWEGEPGKPSRTAVCAAMRTDQSEPYVRKFSAEQAQRAGLLAKPGPWKQYPDRMMMLRARAFCFRDAFADALGGLLVAEEVQDYPIKDVTPADSSFLDDEPPKPISSIDEVATKTPAVVTEVTTHIDPGFVNATPAEVNGGESEAVGASTAPSPSPDTEPSGAAPDQPQDDPEPAEDWKARTKKVQDMIRALDDPDVGEHFASLLNQQLEPFKAAGRGMDAAKLKGMYETKMTELREAAPDDEPNTAAEDET